MVMWAIDNLSNLAKKMTVARSLVSDPIKEFVRREALQPIKGGLSMWTKGPNAGSVKNAYYPVNDYYPKYSKEWEISYCYFEDLLKDCSPSDVIRTEPNFCSYPDADGHNEAILMARDKRVMLRECDAKLTARMRGQYGIPEDEVTDATDAILLYIGKPGCFSESKLTTEKIRMDRSAVCKALEAEEDIGWSGSLSQAAVKAFPLKSFGEKFGTDLAAPVFVVTAYAAAQDVFSDYGHNVKDFDRFCGLFAKARGGRGPNKGVGSVISSNLSHFNDNPNNIKAARYVFHRVCSGVDSIDSELSTVFTLNATDNQAGGADRADSEFKTVLTLTPLPEKIQNYAAI